MKVTVIIGEQRFEDFDPSRFTFGEAEAIERTFGGSLKAWGQALADGSMTAQKILCWSLLRRSNPGLRIGDLNEMPISDVRVDVEDEPSASPTEGATPSPGSASDTSETSLTGSTSDPGSGTA